MKYFQHKRQHLREKYLFGFLAISLFLALPSLTKAAPGDLDLGFGSSGIVITRGSDINHIDTAWGMAIQSDGKIVVVGDGNLGNLNFTVIRYNTDGSLDSSFGGGGIVLTPVGNSHDQAASVAFQTDGKIVVAGGIYNDIPGSRFGIVRYNPNGTLDTSFNGTGKVITPVGGIWDWAFSVAIQSDGKIVVAGSSGGNVGSNSDFALVRYNTDGSLDTTFNGTGKVITQTGVGVNSVVIQSDGKIIAAGGTALVRYNTDGTLDTSFNGTGKVTIPIGSYSVTIQPDGKIVAVGGGFAVVRYNPNGSLDTTFGGTGKIIIPIGNFFDLATSVAIQTDGKIVAAGTSAIGALGRNFVG